MHATTIKSVIERTVLHLYVHISLGNLNLIRFNINKITIKSDCRKTFFAYIINLKLNTRIIETEF